MTERSEKEMVMAERLGTQVGHYRLTRLLGQGSYAEVYLGEHIHLRTQAALKLLHTTLATTGEVEQFRQEAQRLAGLQHPHIVRVLDFGFEGEVPFLVLEYAPGGSLRQRHPSGRPVPLATVLGYVEQIAEALHYAHDQQVIHRDLKPQNLLLGRRGEVLLADFGISVIAASTSQHSSTKAFAGTAAYAAPEQIQGHPRPASDQYALGIVVYEWLTGQLPFTGSLPEVLWKQMQSPPPPLHPLAPGVPAEVEQVVLTALTKDPKERFGSMRAFANALLQARGAVTSTPLSPVPETRRAPSLPPTAVPTPALSEQEAAIAVQVQPSPSPPAPAQGPVPAALLDVTTLQSPPTSQPMAEEGKPARKGRTSSGRPTRAARIQRLLLVVGSSLLILTLLALLVHSHQITGGAQPNATATGTANALAGTNAAGQTQITQGETTTAGNATATANAGNATATAVAKEPYQAHVPGPTCDQGRLRGSWSTPVGGRGITCLRDWVHVIGVSQASGCDDNGITFTPPQQDDFTVSIGVRYIEGTVQVSIDGNFSGGVEGYVLDAYAQTWELDKVPYSNTEPPLASVAFDNTRTNTIAITVQGTTVRWLLNGSTFATVSESAPIAVSSFGFGVIGCVQSIQADFQNFVFAPLS
jgi:serine/threonine protein kinase